MVWTKQTRLIRCLLYGYKRAKGLVGKMFGLHHKLWTGKLTNQSMYYVSHIIKVYIQGMCTSSSDLILTYESVLSGGGHQVKDLQYLNLNYKPSMYSYKWNNNS